MKVNKKFLSLLICLILLTSCGANSNMMDKSTTEAFPSSVENTETALTADVKNAEKIENNENEETISIGENYKDLRKIKKTYNYSIETKSFKEDYEILQKVLEKYNGFETSSNMYSNTGDSLKRYDIEIKVPIDNSEEFKKELENIGVVVQSGSVTDDITFNYINTESELETLNLQLESMKKMYEKATTMEDLIKIQERIDAIEYEINQKSQEKSKMDFSIEFDTYNIYLQEVVEEKNIVSDNNQSFMVRARQQFLNSLYNLKLAVSGFILWIIGNWYKLVFLALLIWIAKILYDKFSGPLSERRLERRNKKLEKELNRRERAKKEREEYIKFRESNKELKDETENKDKK